MKKRMRWIPVLYVALFLPLTLVAEAGSEDWSPVAEQVNEQLDSALEAYRAGDPQAARRGVIQAYFGPFEGEKMEAAIRSQFGIEPAFLLERQFGALRKAIKQGAELHRVSELAEQLQAALMSQADKLNEAGVPRTVFEVNQ